MASKLDDRVYSVRLQALKTLGLMRPPVLANHTTAILDSLEDVNRPVVEQALETLGELPLALLAPHRHRLAGTRLLGPLLLFEMRRRLRARLLLLWWNALSWEPGRLMHCAMVDSWGSLCVRAKLQKVE